MAQAPCDLRPDLIIDLELRASSHEQSTLPHLPTSHTRSLQLPTQNEPACFPGAHSQSPADWSKPPPSPHYHLVTPGLTIIIITNIPPTQLPTHSHPTRPLLVDTTLISINTARLPTLLTVTVPEASEIDCITYATIAIPRIPHQQRLTSINHVELHQQLPAGPAQVRSARAGRSRGLHKVCSSVFSFFDRPRAPAAWSASLSSAGNAMSAVSCIGCDRLSLPSRRIATRRLALACIATTMRASVGSPRATLGPCLRCDCSSLPPLMLLGVPEPMA